MDKIFTVLRAAQRLTETINVPSASRTGRFDFSRFAEGDRVYITGKRPRISKPLHRSGKLDLPDGFISHDALIGARPGQTFRTNTGKAHRVILPDLDTYISSTPRKVTPVYGTYANYITSLFDIHVAPTAPARDDYDDHNVLEVLDAGTGHGSVTLSLARAIQAANPPMPNLDLETKIPSNVDVVNPISEETSATGEGLTETWQDWFKARRAIVHSVEVSEKYSKHAERNIICGFRRGLYLPHIDFHVAKVHDWIAEQLQRRHQQRFLSYGFLDMPSCHRSLRSVANAMKDEALVAVFVPNITQIGDCLQTIKTGALPLKLEKVLELGEGISNGRRWDVRFAFKRGKDSFDECDNFRFSERGGSYPTQMDEHKQSDSTTKSQASSEAGCSLESLGGCISELPENEAPVMVCRPKVGEVIIGGGFVGLWRRLSSETE